MNPFSVRTEKVRCAAFLHDGYAGPNADALLPHVPKERNLQESHDFPGVEGKERRRRGPRRARFILNTYI